MKASQGLRGASLRPCSFEGEAATLHRAPTLVAATILQLLATARTHAQSRAQDPFATATEARLDSLYGPLVYIMRGDERGVYASLSTAERRVFLRRFWEVRDPTPGTPENEAMAEFYDRVAIANRDFREGGAGSVAGWRTDRGRVLIMHGVPDEALRQPQPAETSPYEAWKYTRGRPLKFVFVDLSRFGHYALVWTNDVREVIRPNWRMLLGPRAVEEVMRF